MRRRSYLGALAGVGTAVGLSGCSGLIETQELPSTPDVLEDRPDGVYFPTHVDGMEMAGMATADDEYAFALGYTYPHRFWRVDATTETVDDAKLQPVDGTDVHLMALVWDPQTGRVLPDAGLSVDIERDGESLEEGVIYPMLSQRMGFHYGANVPLPAGDGTYDVTLSVGGTDIRRTGAYRGRFGDSASVPIEFAYSAETRNELPFEDTSDRAGDAEAPPVMEMDMPLGVAPDPDSMPGEYRGTAESGDARLAVVSLDSPPAGVDGDGTYLAISARTPYNQLTIPSMALEASLERSGEPIFEGALERTFDDELGYHYGAAVGSIESGDELSITVRTSPQVARHEGYETAFLQLPETSLTL